MPKIPDRTPSLAIRSSPLGCSRFFMLAGLYVGSLIVFVTTWPLFGLIQDYGWQPSDDRDFRLIIEYIVVIALITPFHQYVGGVILLGLGLLHLNSYAILT